MSGGEVCGDGESLRVELRVKGLDAIQEEVYEFSGGDFFGCDHVPDFPGWCECEIGGVHGAPPVGWGGLSVKLVWGMVTRGELEYGRVTGVEGLVAWGVGRGDSGAYFLYYLTTL